MMCPVRNIARCLAFLFCSWHGPAGAQPAAPPAVARPEARASARALIERGIALRMADDDRGAHEAFARAWAIGGSAEALAQLALSEQALGLWLDAHEHVTAALRHAEDDWIRTHRPILESALAEMESRFGRLELTCNVAGSEVSLDGRVVGKTPLAEPLRLLAGRSVIRLSAKGYFDVARQVQIDAGALSRLEVTLSSTATHSGEATASPTPHDVLKYGSLGLTALGAAVGIAGYVTREINVNFYNDDSTCSRDARSRSEECPDAAAAWRLGEAMAIGGFAAMGVFGAVSLFFWLDEPSGSDVVAAACGAGFGSVGCRMTF
jgi:hypothetical protein